MEVIRYKGFAAIAAAFILFVLSQPATAGPPQKPGNPGVPGLLAEISQLNEYIAELEAIIQDYEQFSPIPKTGQTTSYETGDDGDLQTGLPWPDPRFTDNEDGTVTDNLTGLIWLQDANCFGARTWADALNDCNMLGSGACGLTDGSVAGNWRLPNVRELESLVDYGRDNPSLPELHPFAALVAGRYWSSTATDISAALVVNFYFGYVDHYYKDIDFYVWPVRDAK